MAQLSRPYQIALGVIVVLGLIWAVALRGHASSPSEPVPTSPSASIPTTTASNTSAAAEAKAAAAPTPIYHGAAPGVEGLTRAIAKAHGAVATSQQNARQLQSKSSEASQESQPSSAAHTGTSANAASKARQKSIVAATVAHKTVVHRRVVSKSHIGRTPQQIAVEAELAHGKTVMLVFWNPRSSVDREVLAQAEALAGTSKNTVAVHAAFAHQVGLFGTITEVVHVYQTPTILIINRRGLVSTLTGLTDQFSLEQAVREARTATR